MKSNRRGVGAGCGSNYYRHVMHGTFERCVALSGRVTLGIRRHWVSMLNRADNDSESMTSPT